MKKCMKRFFGKDVFEVEDQFEKAAIWVLNHSYAAREIFSKLQFNETVFDGDFNTLTFVENEAYLESLDCIARGYKRGVSEGTWRRMVEKVPKISYKDEWGIEDIIGTLAGDWQV